MINRYSSIKKNDKVIKELQTSKILKNSKRKRSVLAQNLEIRRKEWLDQISGNEEFKKLYDNGANKIVHPLHIKFRKRNKEMERSKKCILAYKYLPDRAKSMSTLQEYRNGHLNKEKYDDQAPLRHTGWLRPRVKDNEINPKLRYSVKTENERLGDHFKKSSLINSEPLDTEMLYNTPYRPVQKKKWVSNKQYVT